MSVNVAALEATLDANVRGFMRGMKKADRQLGDTERSAKRFAGKIGRGITTMAKWGAAASAAAGVATFALGKKAVDAAADLNESINAVEVVFGDAAGTVKSFSETAVDEIGLAQVKVNKAATVLGSALQGAGFSADQAAESTVGLTTRAADMASVFNTDVNTALESIQAAIRGEIDPIEKFGVSMNAASVEAKALEMGLHEGTGEMSAQAKTVARLAVIMEQTQRVAGDYANTSDSVANAQKRLKERVTELMGELGQRLLPVAKDAIGWLETNGIDAVRSLGNWFLDHLIPAMGRFVGFVRGSVVPAAQTFVAWFQREIVPRVQEFVDAVEDNWPTIEGIFEDLGRIVGEVAGIFTDSMDRMTESTEEGTGSIGEDVNSIAEDVERITNALAGLTELAAILAKGARFLVDRFTGQFDRLEALFTGRYAMMFARAGRDLVLGLLRGAKSVAGDVVDWFAGLGRRAKDAVEDELGISSPSRVFAEIGADTVRGFIQGIEDQETTLNQVIRDVFEQAVSGAQDILSGLGAITGRQQAQQSVAEAEAALASTQQTKRSLPQQIAEAKKALQVAKDAAEVVTPSEQLKIMRARKRVADAEERLAEAREEGNLTSLEMAILEAEVTEAQEDLTAAKRAAEGPTDDVRAAERKLNDLLDKQAGIDRKLREAQNDLTRAKRQAVRAEIALVEAGRQLVDQGPEAQRMFTQMAERAGVSADEVARMVEQTQGLTGRIEVGGASRSDLIEDMDQMRQEAAEAAEAIGGGGGGGGLAGAIEGLPDEFSLDFLVDNSDLEDTLEMLREIEQATGKNISGVTGDATAGFPSGGITMHSGGTVPGPRGAPVPVIAHGGEHFSGMNRSRGGGGVTIHIDVHGSVFTEDELLRKMQEGLRQEVRRSGRNRL